MAAWTTNDELCFLFGGGAAGAKGLVNMTPEKIASCRLTADKPRCNLTTVLEEYLANLRSRRWDGCSVEVNIIEETLKNWMRANTHGERNMIREDVLRAKGAIL